jgi:hypothetical protein
MRLNGQFLSLALASIGLISQAGHGQRVSYGQPCTGIHCISYGASCNGYQCMSIGLGATCTGVQCTSIGGNCNGSQCTAIQLLGQSQPSCTSTPCPTESGVNCFKTCYTMPLSQVPSFPFTWQQWQTQVGACVGAVQAKNWQAAKTLCAPIGPGGTPQPGVTTLPQS